MAKRRIAVRERLPPARASEYVSVSVQLPKGVHAKADEIAHAYGLSLSAWFRSLAYERIGYEAHLKPGEMARLLSGGRAEAQAMTRGDCLPPQRVQRRRLGDPRRRLPRDESV